MSQNLDKSSSYIFMDENRKKIGKNDMDKFLDCIKEELRP